MLFLYLLLFLSPVCGSQKVDVTSRAVMDIMTKTTEYLQPNPGDRNQQDEYMIDPSVGPEFVFMRCVFQPPEPR